MQESERLMTCDEVAQRCRVSVETVWRWVRTGKLAAVKIGSRNYRVRRGDLDAFEQMRKTK